MRLVCLCIREAANTGSAIVRSAVLSRWKTRYRSNGEGLHRHRQIHTCNGTVTVRKAATWRLVADVAARRRHVRRRRVHQLVRSFRKAAEAIFAAVSRGGRKGHIICVAVGAVRSGPYQRYGYIINTGLAGVLNAVKVAVFEYQITHFGKGKLVVFDFAERHRIRLLIRFKATGRA